MKARIYATPAVEELTGSSEAGVYVFSLCYEQITKPSFVGVADMPQYVKLSPLSRP